MKYFMITLLLYECITALLIQLEVSRLLDNSDQHMKMKNSVHS
jgi:hypothetical protein